jgi:hypothetical protein
MSTRAAWVPSLGNLDDLLSFDSKFDSDSKMKTQTDALSLQSPTVEQAIPFSVNAAANGAPLELVRVAPSKKIGFLFVHERSHHIPHSAPILNALALQSSKYEIHAFVRKPENLVLLKSLLSSEALRRINLTVLKTPVAATGLEFLAGGAAPIGRIGALYANRNLLKNMDVIVSPETTCLLLKTRFGLDKVKFVYSQHGAGDRSIGFNPSLKKFDHILIPGQKILDRMLNDGIVCDCNSSVVGYPKFDIVDLSATHSSRLFDNDNPTVLYNPHFDPGLSSWFGQGEQVLEYFSERPDYNLIVAPHIMLFTRRLHVSGDFRNLKWRRRIERRYFDCPNILIDTGSNASIDMTYTRAADIYIGDVSSQVYEFLYQPGLCIFLNTHGVDWAGDPNYAHWELGKVISSPTEIDGLLAQRTWLRQFYMERQKTAFRNTFGNSATGSANRAAQALEQLA